MITRPPRASMVLDRAHRFCCCRFLKSIRNVPESAATPRQNPQRTSWNSATALPISGKTRNSPSATAFPIRNATTYGPQRHFPIPRVQGVAQREWPRGGGLIYICLARLLAHALCRPSLWDIKSFASLFSLIFHHAKSHAGQEGHEVSRFNKSSNDILVDVPSNLSLYEGFSLDDSMQWLGNPWTCSYGNRFYLSTCCLNSTPAAH